MPVRYVEPEGGTPSPEPGIIPIAYAGVADVEGMNKGRTPGQGKNPTTEDIVRYLEFIASEIDGILIDKGYQLPIPSSATGAMTMLRRINAQGAALEVEQASPSSEHIERFEKMYQTSIEMLKTADLVMNVPKADERAKPRGPGVTVAPGSKTNLEYEKQEAKEESGNIGEQLGKSIPYFRRGMRF